MRVRYERREPRGEDIARINELKTVVDSQEKDICQMTEQLRELQLQMQTYQNQQNSNQLNGITVGGGNKRNRGKSSSNKSSNRNNANNNQQQQNVKQQQQSNAVNQDDESSEQQRMPQNKQQQRMKPPPLIKTVIYEEENENELYEEQIREERERDAAAAADFNNEFTVELVPESPDGFMGKRNLEEISEALIVQDHEILNQPVIPSPTPDHKNQEFSIEIISTIEPSHIQVIPFGNSLDIELD